jgi:ABC-type antimicrobial peptide transport system permease subunit
MDEWLARAIGTRTLTTWLVVFFGGAALLLAALGIYGVISYASNLRTREFGIRLALGGTPGHIRRLVLGQSFKVVLVGCAMGFMLTAPVGRALKSLLFGINGSDETSLVIAPAVLVAVALLASAAPVRRAARVDPAVTLRAE